MLLPNRRVYRHNRDLRSKKLSTVRSSSFRPETQCLDERILLSTFTVTNLNDVGPGSLNSAILNANAAPGADTIDFTMAGTILLNTPLPAITDTVDINGTTAPQFINHTPSVEIDFKGLTGLNFDAGSSGSALKSLGLVRAGGDAVILNSSNNLLTGNFIGVRLDGVTTGANTGNGLVISASSSGNTIGAALVGPNVLSIASNVISANGGNGISLHGSSQNTIIANYVGTDSNGLKDLGNTGDGILLDASSGNTIGGTVSFVNSLNDAPLGNLVSGNHGDGIALTNGSSSNFLAANFVGTDVTGIVAVGNDGDGVDILNKSNLNVLQGTVVGLKPFVYANIISGNHGNGLRMADSDTTIINANFFGLAYDNKTPLGNDLDGVLIEGTSSVIAFGGVIPLGNVTAANGRNGVELRDQVSGFQSFNTFAGVAAFQPYTNLGNHQNGFLVTATGGSNQIRTSVVSSNRGNGIEISGDATDVQVVVDIIGLNTDGTFPISNGGHGVVVSGNASRILIGGPLPLDPFSIIPRNIISGNVGHGVVFLGTAHNNLVTDSYIGTDTKGNEALGNGGSGIYLGATTYSNTIGGPISTQRNLISGNSGNGIELIGGTTGNVIQGNAIGTDTTQLLPIGNGGNGIFIAGALNNLIGGTASSAGNLIAFNVGAGVFIASGNGNAIVQNSISQNGNAGIVLLPGANANQAAPKLTLFKRCNQRSAVRGVIHSVANSTFQVELFVSPARFRSSGGQTYLSTATVQTNNKGVGHFLLKFLNRARGTNFTTTATSVTNNTSVFSNAVPYGK